MARGIPHPPELRAAVIAAVQDGASVSEAAQQFQLDRTLVWRWVAVERRRHEPMHTDTAAPRRPVATDQRGPENLTALTAVIADHLRETLRAMSSTRTPRR
jgi:transposase-like protein